MAHGPVRRTRGLLRAVRRWVRKVLRILGWIVAGFWFALFAAVTIAVVALIQAERWCGGPGTCSTLVQGVAIGALVGDALALALLVTITSYWVRIHLLGKSADRVLGVVEPEET